MGIFAVVGLFFASMFNSVHADQPKQMIVTIDGQSKMAVVQKYHKPVKNIGYNNVLAGGFYLDSYGEWQVKK